MTSSNETVMLQWTLYSLCRAKTFEKLLKYSLNQQVLHNRLDLRASKGIKPKVS